MLRTGACTWLAARTVSHRDGAFHQMAAFTPPRVASTTLAILGEPPLDETTVGRDVEAVLGRAPRAFDSRAHDYADLVC